MQIRSLTWPPPISYPSEGKPMDTAYPRKSSTSMASMPCLVCGGRYQPSSLVGLWQCETCGFISADLVISDDDLHSLYSDGYFKGEEYLDYAAEEQSLRINFRRRIATLKSLEPELHRKVLFEVGCAYGYFLDEARGAVQHASGIDVSADAVRFATERLHLPAVAGDYLSHRVEPSPDIVAMWDTIEHLKRPDLFIEKASQDLKPGGLIALTTGDIGSLNARVRGRRWRMIHPPTHLNYFSRQTVSRLLTRFGFDIVHLSHPGSARQLRSALYIILALKAKRPRLYELISSARILDRSVTVNLFDIMFVVGRRR